MPHRPPPSLALSLALGLAACGAPPAADFEPSEQARRAPPPQLAPTATFDAALARAAPDAQRIEGDAETLAARGEALRARAAALAAPVVDPALRPRLAPADDAR